MARARRTPEGSLAEALPGLETTERTCLVVPTLAVPTLAWGYTYTCPAELPHTTDLAPGALVLINLHGQIRKGIVVALDPPRPEGVDLKPLLAIYPGGPLMTPHQIALADWLARFYHASLFSALHLNFWDLKFFQTAHAWRIVDPLHTLELLEARGFRFGGDSAVLEEFRDQVLREADLGPFWEALELQGTEPAMVLPYLIAQGALVPDYQLRQTKRTPIEPGYRGASEIDPATLTATELELWRNLLQFAPPLALGAVARTLPQSTSPMESPHR